MRDYRDSKAMAHSLREALSHKAIAVSHSECLELIAKSFGVDTWNILSAKIEATAPTKTAATPKTLEQAGIEELAKGPVLYCSFCGKSQHDVAILIAGPTVFVCNECVSVCTEIVDDYSVTDLLKRDPPAARRFLEGRTQEQLAAFINGCNGNIDRATTTNRDIGEHLAARDAGKVTTAPPLGTKTPEQLAELRAKGERSIAITQRAMALAQEIMASRAD
jgi:hypothetical protein